MFMTPNMLQATSALEDKFIKQEVPNLANCMAWMTGEPLRFGICTSIACYSYLNPLIATSLKDYGLDDLNKSYSQWLGYAGINCISEGMLNIPGTLDSAALVLFANGKYVGSKGGMCGFCFNPFEMQDYLPTMWHKFTDKSVTKTDMKYFGSYDPIYSGRAPSITLLFVQENKVFSDFIKNKKLNVGYFTYNYIKNYEDENIKFLKFDTLISLIDHDMADFLKHYTTFKKLEKVICYTYQNRIPRNPISGIYGTFITFFDDNFLALDPKFMKILLSTKTTTSCFYGGFDYLSKFNPLGECESYLQIVHYCGLMYMSINPERLGFKHILGFIYRTNQCGELFYSFAINYIFNKYNKKFIRRQDSGGGKGQVRLYLDIPENAVWVGNLLVVK